MSNLQVPSPGHVIHIRFAVCPVYPSLSSRINIYEKTSWILAADLLKLDGQTVMSRFYGEHYPQN